MGFSLPVDNQKNMSVKIVTAVKQLPQYSRETKDILPFLDVWLEGQEERFIKKVKKIFEGAAVDKRYSIMEPTEVFTAKSPKLVRINKKDLRNSKCLIITCCPK